MDMRPWTINGLGEFMKAHVARDEEQYKKLDEMYEDVETGNAHPSMKSELKRHSDWIANANRLIWIIVTAVLGQLVILACGTISILYNLFVMKK